MSKVVCIGDACVDIITRKGSSNYTNFSCGGANANSAYGLGKLNVDVSFVGMAGNDIYGQKMKDVLTDANVNTDLFLLDEKESTKILIEIDKNNDRFPRLLTNINPSYLQIKDEQLNKIDLSNTQYILTNGMMLFENPAASAITSFLEKVHSLGIKIILDINYRIETIDKDRQYLDRVIKISDYLLGSKEEEIIPISNTDNIDDAVKILVNKNRVIVARNSYGADIYTIDEHIHTDSYPVDVIDTPGAGDAYNAGFIYGLVNNKSLEQCNKLGCASAAINIKKEGARNTPSEIELIDFIIIN